MKIVINKCYGGFSLSKLAYKELGIELDRYGFDYDSYKNRSDPKLVEVVEKLGDKANGTFAELKIVTIPDGIDWEIQEYDGIEIVEEVHRKWY